MISAPLVQGEDILKFIPQRDPIVMVDTLFACEEKTASTGLSVSNVDDLFLDQGKMLESGLIEHMAQSCAIHAGYAPLLAENGGAKKPSMGFIAEVKSLVVHQLPSTESTLKTIIEVTNEVMNIIVVRCKTKDGSGPVCDCEMKIFLQPEE